MLLNNTASLTEDSHMYVVQWWNDIGMCRMSFQNNIKPYLNTSLHEQKVDTADVWLGVWLHTLFHDTFSALIGPERLSSLSGYRLHASGVGRSFSLPALGTTSALHVNEYRQVSPSVKHLALKV